MLQGKKVLVGVCGSIAAYKSAYLVRQLVKAGAEVKVVMTPAATEFISTLTLSTLSKNTAYKDWSTDKGEWNNHVELGLWADVFVIAPASANTLAKLANGLCDNLLSAIYLSAKCPVVFSPAMDLDMWKHDATQKNVRQLEEYGNKVIPVNHGELASGLVGEGRMAEPEEIVEYLDNLLSGQKKSLPNNPYLAGKKVLITAGPTVEPIDPVRFISNHSSGKMGIAIAETLALHGAQVILVKGPTSVNTSMSNIKVVPVRTAQEMYEASIKWFSQMDVAIMAAAVADYTPENPATSKIKKKGDDMSLSLTKTKDILKSLGNIKEAHQLLVGFALETDDAIQHARSKLEEKNADLIVLNSLQDKGAGFGLDTNKISILAKDGSIIEYDTKSKKEVAKDIVDEIAKQLHGKENPDPILLA